MVGKRLLTAKTEKVESAEPSLHSSVNKGDIELSDMAQPSEPSAVAKPQTIAPRSASRRIPSLPLQVQTRQRERAKEGKENGVDTAPAAEDVYNKATVAAQPRAKKQRTSSVGSIMSTVSSAPTESTHTGSENGDTTRQKKRGRPPKQRESASLATSPVEVPTTIRSVVKGHQRREQRDQHDFENSVSRDHEPESPNFRRSTRHRTATKRLDDSIEMPKKRKRRDKSTVDADAHELKSDEIDFADHESIGGATSIESDRGTSYDGGHTTETDTNTMDLDEISSQSSVVKKKKRGRKPKNQNVQSAELETQNEVGATEQPRKKPPRKIARAKRENALRKGKGDHESELEFAGDDTDATIPPPKRQRRKRKQIGDGIEVAGDNEAIENAILKPTAPSSPLIVTLKFPTKAAAWVDLTSKFDQSIVRKGKKRGPKSSIPEPSQMPEKVARRVSANAHFPGPPGSRMLKRKTLHPDVAPEQQCQQDTQMPDVQPRLKLRPTKLHLKMPQSKPGRDLNPPLSHAETIEFTQMAQKLRQQEVLDSLETQHKYNRKPTKEEVIKRVEHLKREREILSDGIAGAFETMIQTCKEDIKKQNPNTDMLTSCGFEDVVKAVKEVRDKKVGLANTRLKYQQDDFKEQTRLAGLQVHKQYALDVTAIKTQHLMCLKLQQLKYTLLLDGESEDSEIIEELEENIDKFCELIGISESEEPVHLEDIRNTQLVRGLGSTMLPYTNEESLKFHKKTGRLTNAKWDPSYESKMRREINDIIQSSQPTHLFGQIMRVEDEENMYDLVDAVQEVEGTKLAEMDNGSRMDLDTEDTGNMPKSNKVAENYSHNLDLLAEIASETKSVEPPPQDIEVTQDTAALESTTPNGSPPSSPKPSRVTSPILASTMAPQQPLSEAFQGSPLADFQDVEPAAIPNISLAASSPARPAMVTSDLPISTTPIGSPIGSKITSRAASPIISQVASQTVSPIISRALSPVASPTGSPVTSPVASPARSLVGSPMKPATTAPVLLRDISRASSPVSLPAPLAAESPKISDMPSPNLANEDIGMVEAPDNVNENRLEDNVEPELHQEQPPPTSTEPKTMEIDQAANGMTAPQAVEADQEAVSETIIKSEEQPTLIDLSTETTQMEAAVEAPQIPQGIIQTQLEGMQVPIEDMRTEPKAPDATYTMQPSLVNGNTEASNATQANSSQGDKMQPLEKPAREPSLKTDLNSRGESISILQVDIPNDTPKQTSTPPVTAQETPTTPIGTRRSKSAGAPKQDQPRPAPLLLNPRNTTPRSRRRSTIDRVSTPTETVQGNGQNEEGLGQSITVSAPVQALNNVAQGPKSADPMLAAQHHSIPPLHKALAPKRRRSEAPAKTRASSTTQLANIAPNYVNIEAKQPSQALPPMHAALQQLSPMEPSPNAVYQTYHAHPDPYVSAQTHPLYEPEGSYRGRRQSATDYAPGFVLSGPPAVPPPSPPRQRSVDPYTGGHYPTSATYASQHSWSPSPYGDVYRQGNAASQDPNSIDPRLYHRHSVPQLPSMFHPNYQVPSHYTHHQPPAQTYPPPHQPVEIGQRHASPNPHQHGSSSYYMYPPRPSFGSAHSSASPAPQNPQNPLPYPPPLNSSISEQERRYSYFQQSPSQASAQMYQPGNPSPSPTLFRTEPHARTATPSAPSMIPTPPAAPSIPLVVAPPFRGEPHKVYIGDGKYKYNTAPPSNEVRPPLPGTVFQFDRLVQDVNVKFAEEKRTVKKDDAK